MPPPLAARRVEQNLREIRVSNCLAGAWSNQRVCVFGFLPLIGPVVTQPQAFNEYQSLRPALLELSQKLFAPPRPPEPAQQDESRLIQPKNDRDQGSRFRKFSSPHQIQTGVGTENPILDKQRIERHQQLKQRRPVLSLGVVGARPRAAH